MKIDKRAIACILVVIGVLMLDGCYKADTLYPNNDKVLSDSVSFAKDIIPIFTQKCAIAGCHASGGHAPDLSATKAYSSLVNGKFIDVSNPKNSIIYERLTGKLLPAMPLTGASNPSNINQLVLTWITQGAKNN